MTMACVGRYSGEILNRPSFRVLWVFRESPQGSDHPGVVTWPLCPLATTPALEGLVA